MKIRENLMLLRKYKNISVYQLSKETGLNESIIRKIESGKRTNPSIRTVTKLCKYFEISMDEFILKDLTK